MPWTYLKRYTKQDKELTRCQHQDEQQGASDDGGHKGAIRQARERNRKGKGATGKETEGGHSNNTSSVIACSYFH